MLDLLNFNFQWEFAIRLLLAVGLSGLIGLERQLRQEPAGLRTHMIVCLGSTLITIISIYGFSIDPARIAASILTGIGFLGAGTIIAKKDKVIGLTTAASLWFIAGLGIVVGVGMYTMAIIATMLSLVILNLWRLERKAGLKNHVKKR
jgi:putative Mg2+ transporter-C (MgtC) family protein